MKIYRPIRTNRKTQGFGENMTCVNRLGKVTDKIKIGLTFVCPAGYTDLYKTYSMLGHNGEDWALWRGEPVYNPIDGMKFRVKTEVDGNGGIGVNLISMDRFEGNYLKFKFWHLQKVAVHDDQMVEAGALIGYGDSTGLSSGDHLHWSMKPCDAQGNVLNRNNGYTGAVDFSPHFENVFILDVLLLKEKALDAIQKTNKLIFQIRQLLAYLLLRQ